MVVYPFWTDVIQPLVEAADARRIVEIGALKGENTIQMISDLPTAAELHVIDPAPAFGAEFERLESNARFVLHRDLSLTVLPHLGQIDVALVDGDHNWYTVYHELRLLHDRLAKQGRWPPIVLLHDVLWPHGRRDQYYDVSTIPEEYRKPYREYEVDGVTVCNAVEEGGQRNGVMCALRDFLADHDGQYRVVLLPIYFGLAIVVDKQRLAETPTLSEFLDWLESAKGRFRLLCLAEQIRVREMLLATVTTTR